MKARIPTPGAPSTRACAGRALSPGPASCSPRSSPARTSPASPAPGNAAGTRARSSHPQTRRPSPRGRRNPDGRGKCGLRIADCGMGRHGPDVAESNPRGRAPRHSDFRLPNFHMPPPAGGTVFAQQSHHRQFHVRVPPRPNPRHHCAALLLGKDIRHRSGAAIGVSTMQWCASCLLTSPPAPRSSRNPAPCLSPSASRAP
jgi:hypothetical protein